MSIAGWKPLRLLVALVALVLLVHGGPAEGATQKWTLVLEPPNAGTIYWETTTPPFDGGAVFSRKRISLEEGTTLILTVDAHPGFKLVGFFQDDFDLTASILGGGSLFFGPIQSAHKITAKYAVSVPTGDFDFSTLGAIIPSIVDLTGNYTGVSPTRHNRNYAFDVAQDERGKLDAMGTVDGIEPDGGGPLEGGVGKVKTVNGEPRLEAKGKFAGTRDGAVTTGAGSIKGPAELQQVGPDPNVAMTSLTYNTKVGGVPFKDKNVPVQTPVDAPTASNVKSDWSIRVCIEDAAPGKRKRVAMASATLVLPNGDTIEFPPKTVRFSPRRGYKLNFKKGLNVTLNPPAVDKKTKIKIVRMTLFQVGDTWDIEEGTIKYKFLGQKGSASLLDFSR